MQCLHYRLQAQGSLLTLPSHVFIQALLPLQRSLCATLLLALGMGLLYSRIAILLRLRLVLQEHLLRLCSVRLLLRAQLFFLQCPLGGQLVFR